MKTEKYKRKYQVIIVTNRPVRFDRYPPVFVNKSAPTVLIVDLPTLKTYRKRLFSATYFVLRFYWYFVIK